MDVKAIHNKNGGSVIVRGISSLTNQKPPLFVVDGVVYGGDITNINPQDVDVITVLKDAAFASAYRAQGAAWVILITTKNGSAGVNNVVVKNHNESACAYFIEHKIKLKLIGLNDEIIITGVVQKEQDSSLIFYKETQGIIGSH